jgi:hypothetical protein
MLGTLVAVRALQNYVSHASLKMLKQRERMTRRSPSILLIAIKNTNLGYQHASLFVESYDLHNVESDSCTKMTCLVGFVFLSRGDNNNIITELGLWF